MQIPATNHNSLLTPAQGKDLKQYGLHNDPDITVFRREESHKGFILASDGLWDTIECQQAFGNAFYALNRGRSYD